MPQGTDAALGRRGLVPVSRHVWVHLIRASCLIVRLCANRFGIVLASEGLPAEQRRVDLSLFGIRFGPCRLCFPVTGSKLAILGFLPHVTGASPICLGLSLAAEEQDYAEDYQYHNNHDDDHCQGACVHRIPSHSAGQNDRTLSRLLKPLTVNQENSWHCFVMRSHDRRGMAG